MKVLIDDEVNNVDIIDQEMDFNSIFSSLKNLSENPFSEIKIYHKNSSNYQLSIVCRNIEKCKIDYPIEVGKIHKQRYANKQQCLYFLKKIYNKKEIKPEDNFLDVPIQHFTLDEMLEFKHEDDMLLRGEDPNINNQTIKAQPQNTIQSPAKKTTPTVQKKSKSQSLQTLGNHIKPKLETPKPNLNKIAEKIIKNKPTDDNSFFQI